MIEPTEPNDRNDIADRAEPADSTEANEPADSSEARDRHEWGEPDAVARRAREPAPRPEPERVERRESPTGTSRRAGCGSRPGMGRP